MPLKFVRKLVKQNFKEELYKEFRLDSSKVFNKITGEVEAKYAWDSVICHLFAEHNEVFSDILDKVVDSIDDPI